MASRDTCVQVDLGVLAANARLVKRSLGADTKLLAAVKADAYGHGMVPSAKAFLSGGADVLGVAMAEEGAALREAGIRSDILIFGPTNPDGARCAVKYDLMQAAYSVDVVRWMEQAAKESGHMGRVHIKVETGMNRIGVSVGEELTALLGELASCENMRVEGIFTHLAAVVDDEEYTHKQAQAFIRGVEMVRNCAGDICVHAANSGGLLLHPELHFDMVRGGILLYGYPPCETEVALSPAMSFLTNVAHLHQVAKGATIGYDRSFTASTPMKIATLPVGYGDGYPRSIGNVGSVLIGRHRAPVIGRVCMDQCMVDVSHVPQVKVGDPVVLWGWMGETALWADEVAHWCNTIPYEVLLFPGKRVARRYVNG